MKDEEIKEEKKEEETKEEKKEEEEIKPKLLVKNCVLCKTDHYEGGDVVTFELISQGGVCPFLIKRYVETKLNVLSLWIKKMNELIFQIKFAIAYLKAVGMDTKLLEWEFNERKESIRK